MTTTHTHTHSKLGVILDSHDNDTHTLHTHTHTHTGLGVILDTYDNDGKRDNPSISGATPISKETYV